MKRSEQDRHADMMMLGRVLSQEDGMTSGELAALKTELSKPAYSGKTSAERVILLMSPVLVDNPEPRRDLHKTCTCLEMLTFLYPLIKAAGENPAWLPITSDLKDRPLAVIRWDDDDFVPLRTAATTPGHALYVCDLALIETPSAENGYKAIMEKYPDPSYSAKVWQTPIEVVWGDLAVVSLSQVQRAEA